MAFDRDTLENIFDATSGACHRCQRPLELCHYGQRGEDSAWGIDATRPHPKSTVLLAACVACLRLAAPPPRRERPLGLSLGTSPPPPVRIGYAARPRDTPR